MLYSDQIIEEVRRRTSLIELVGERVPVKQSGRNFQACCPFHTEKTPSFQINEDEGLYYCFGCGKKGNTYTFVMETKSLSFPEAVRFLAQRAGVSLPVDEQYQTQRVSSGKGKNLLRRVVYEVALIYEENLWKAGYEVRGFLEKRRISEYTAKRFRMGYSIGSRGGESGQNLADLVLQRIKSSLECTHKEVVDSLVTLGLLRRRQSGQFGELFWDRVIFPITKSDLSPLAFGGRIIKDVEGAPKYINSPESPVFEKRRSFFGMGQSFSPAQKMKQAFIVEGYLDVISFSQIGIDNSLAVCGTALTEDHVKILKRFVNKVILIFDGDGAGRAAAARAFTPFLDSGIEVVPVMLEDGEDPDSLTYGRSEEEVRAILKEREGSLLRLYLEVLAGSIRGMERGKSVSLNEINPSEAGRISFDLAKALANIKNPVELEYRLREACGYLGITEVSLLKLVKEAQHSSSSAPKIIQEDSLVREIQRLEPAAQVSAPEISQSRRMSILRRQLLISLIVEPAILCSSSVRSQVALLGVTDQSVNFLTRRLLVTSDDKISAIDDSAGVKVLPGLSRVLVASPEEKEELLAKYSGILVECGLADEGLIEEALQQLSLGHVVLSDPSNFKKVQKKLIEEFSDIVDRVKVSDEIDVLRKKETQESDIESRLSLAQEKLMRKRSIAKVNNS